MSHLRAHFTTGRPVTEVIAFPIIGGVQGSLKLGTQVTVEQLFRARPSGLWLRPAAAGKPRLSRTPSVFLLFRGTQWHGILGDQGFPLKYLLSCQHNTGASLVIFHSRTLMESKCPGKLVPSQLQ